MKAPTNAQPRDESSGRRRFDRGKRRRREPHADCARALLVRGLVATWASAGRCLQPFQGKEERLGSGFGTPASAETAIEPVQEPQLPQPLQQQRSQLEATASLGCCSRSTRSASTALSAGRKTRASMKASTNSPGLSGPRARRGSGHAFASQAPAQLDRGRSATAGGSRRPPVRAQAASDGERCALRAWSAAAKQLHGIVQLEQRAEPVHRDGVEISEPHPDGARARAPPGRRGARPRHQQPLVDGHDAAVSHRLQLSRPRSPAQRFSVAPAPATVT